MVLDDSPQAEDDEEELPKAGAEAPKAYVELPGPKEWLLTVENKLEDS